MKRIAIHGGETHLGEITQLQGTALNVVGTCMEEEHRKISLPGIDAPNYASEQELLDKTKPELVAIANENHRKYSSIMRALCAGCDVVVDKPLCIRMEEQHELEEYLAANPQRRLLNLLTLRADPLWAGLRHQVLLGAIGDPAFVHIRMAVRLKREQRPPWFLDARRSGGLFLDLLIHGIDQMEWITGRRIVALTASTGNLSHPEDVQLRDHASVYCELDNGGSGIVEGQRMLPYAKGQDYRVLIAGTKGYADLTTVPESLRITNENGADIESSDLPASKSVVQDWLVHGDTVPQEASLRANRLAILASISAAERRRIEV